MTFEIYLSIAIVALEVLLRLVPTAKDYSILNRIIDLLIKIQAVVPNRSNGLKTSKTKGLFKKISNVVEEIKTTLK